MPAYNFRHACDHDEVLNLKVADDPAKIRPLRAEMLCSRCQYRQDIADANYRTMHGEFAAMANLRGMSRHQTDYANLIRVRFFDDVMATYPGVLAYADSELAPIARACLLALMNSYSAEWWLNNRTVDFATMLLRYFNANREKFPDYTPSRVNEMVLEVYGLLAELKPAKAKKATKTVGAEKERLEIEYQQEREEREQARARQDAEWEAAERSALV